MPSLRKLVFYLSIVLMVVFVVVPVLGSLFSLEFERRELSDRFEEIRFWGLPLAILMSLSGTIKQKATGESRGIIGLTIGASAISFFILFIMGFASMCSWTTTGILFQQVESKDRKIVVREYGCGATDSGLPTVKIFLVQKVAPYLDKVTEIDTSHIDPREWKRMDIVYED